MVGPRQANHRKFGGTPQRGAWGKPGERGDSLGPKIASNSVDFFFLNNYKQHWEAQIVKSARVLGLRYIMNPYLKELSKYVNIAI